MPSLLIRNVDERTKARLRVRAARHERSMEEEARHLLRAALDQEEAEERSLADSIRARFKRLGGVHLELPARVPPRRPPRFGR
jgi:plasmid stability protein